jgi:HEAT repeat protein
MSFEEQIARLGDVGRPLAQAELKAIANLEQAGLADFWAAWQTFPSDRRLAIVQALDSLAEDNLDLDFRPVLRACLSDPDPAVRAAAIAGLWEDETETTMDRLISLIGDAAGEVREAAVIALAAFAYRAELAELPAAAAQRVYAALLRTATDPEEPLDVRRRAVEGLGYFANSRDAQAEIGRAYAHTELAMRESAVLAMGRSMRETWMPYIQRELQSPSPAMRYEAARAVGEFGADGRPMLAALLPLIDDDDSEVAETAIWSLGQLGGPNARRVLERLARSRDDGRRQAAQEALDELALDEL